ncbi:(2Fe-2S)-binding protein [Advenella kashmirensis W13003]|uniref:(2Fe-2S)-binding protein n=1 Tax=Advenella kashmirensis W13003 TaxID=1424334 RepID=V8QWR6_9BURK|nr:FAD/NAD(P)-binding oxidoreductase [Advenella kashmirensis]ETF04381.1 (2Fe-2S)-binding protein [Advenella kashmirensis W13003]
MKRAPVIVGAGPAGIRAAQILVQAGLRPVVIDEAPKPGGQIYRQQPEGFQRDARALYGFERHKARALHDLANHLVSDDLIEYLPNTLVWDADDQNLYITSGNRHDAVAYETLILATGATDRVLPFNGWTLPGVYTLGGAQIALKYQGCAIGKHVVLAGTGPLLYLVAYQYCKAGARVSAVLDTSPFPEVRQGLRAFAADPLLMAKGGYYMAWLRMRGVPLIHDVSAFEAIGNNKVEAIRWRRDPSPMAQMQVLPCDAVACGFGLRSENQLASLLGCEFVFDEQDRAWLPRVQAGGQSSRANVYLAGDGMRIGGADMAELGGRQCAYRVMQDMGLAHDERQARRVSRQIARGRRTRQLIDDMFAPPTHWLDHADDTLVVCRCEEIRVGDVRRMLHEDPRSGLNRMKALSRVGMGRCQGRMCGAGAAMLLAHEQTIPLSGIERLRSQPPVKPLRIGGAACKP